VKIGLLGLPKSGKTTLFNALTKSHAKTDSFGTKVEPNIAIVEVADERVDRLSAMYKPKKTVRATMEVVDVVGVEQGAAKDDKSPWADVVKVIRNADALALVLRNFDSELSGPPDPAKEFGQMEEEFLLSDMIMVETRLERIEAGAKKGQMTPAVKTEEKVLKRMHEQLNASKPLRELTLDKDEENATKGFQFLTLKSVLAIVNSDEGRLGKNPALLAEIGKTARVIEFAGSFEMELSRLDAADAQAFMQDMGITESARDRLTKLAYETIGYISFFTVGEDEVRAWNITRGQTAVEAAGTIHTDLARGFIAAECFTYEDLKACGSEKAIKEKGKFRLEGKEYAVKDGDILNIRFNV
jgi:ribosome-binding ATPase